MSASFQSYQSICCLRLLKPLESTTTFSSYKNCPREISSLSALDENLAFIFTFPYDHRVLLVQRDHKGHLSAALSASSLGQRQSPRYLPCLLLSAEAQVGVPSVVPSALVSLACYSVCHANFYLILLPTADTLGEFRPRFKFMQLVYYVGRVCPRFSGNRGTRRRQGLPGKAGRDFPSLPHLQVRWAA